MAANVEFWMANNKGGLDLFRTNDYGNAYYAAVTEGDG